ncbi:uncharacterized protein LOC142887069 [Nelusetta ayraudi]|uniref:uncharacterized protein LOC142887069 n=1 Tax=Nelusetta ayraudi TaxID=303726 RepID=UPI003F70267F
MPDDTKGAESQDADTVEPFTSDQQEVTEVDAASDETAAAEISPDGTPEETDPTGALEGIPAEDRPQISAIPLEASDDTDADANTETEEDSLGLRPEEGEPIAVTAAGSETEGTSQEEAASEQLDSQQPVVDFSLVLTDTEEDQEEPSPVLLSKPEGEDGTSEPAAQSVENTEVAQTEEQAPLSVLAEDESDVSLALESQVEPADDEMAVDEVVVLSDDSEEEPQLEETIPNVSAESTNQEASEEHAQVDTEENAEQNSPDSTIMLEEDETVAVILDEESQEDLADVVLSTSEEELEETTQEEAILSVSPGASHQEGSEGTEVETEDVPTPNSPKDGGALEVDEAVVFVSAADENNQEGPAAVSSSPVEEQEEVLEETVVSVSPGTSHQESSKETEVETKVTTTPNLVPAAPEDQTHKSHEKAAVISDVDEESQEDLADVVMSTSDEELEETTQEEAILSVSPAALHQEDSEGTEVETEDVPTPNSPNDGGALEVDEAVVFVSATDENNQEGPAAASSSPVEEQEEVLEETVVSVSPGASHQESSKETEVETKVTTTPNLVPAAPEEDQTHESHEKAAAATATEEPPVSLTQEPVPEEPVLIIVLEDRGEYYEGVTSDVQPEEAAAQPEDTETLGDISLDELVASGTAAAQEVQEPAMVNRGAVLGAALFTLVSFITMGFIWTTIAKKLR